MTKSNWHTVVHPCSPVPSSYMFSFKTKKDRKDNLRLNKKEVNCFPGWQ